MFLGLLPPDLHPVSNGEKLGSESETLHLVVTVIRRVFFLVATSEIAKPYVFEAFLVGNRGKSYRNCGDGSFAFQGHRSKTGHLN